MLSGSNILFFLKNLKGFKLTKIEFLGMEAWRP
jgi:hypothetical protein